MKHQTPQPEQKPATGAKVALDDLAADGGDTAKGGALNAYLRLAGETQGDILGSVTQAG